MKPPSSNLPREDSRHARPLRAREHLTSTRRAPSTARETLPGAIEHFSDEEILAQVLAMNARTTPAVLRLARRILDHCGGLQGLAAATGHQLRQIPGVDRARSARIRAAFEMTQRAHEKSLDFGDGIHHPTEAVRVILSRHAKTGKEVFGILLLDVKNRPRGYKIVSVGTLDQSLVHPREVFREAIADGASKVILFHNHPSGDSRPSAEDVDITRRLVNVGETVGIPVLDHLILGSGGTYTSLKDMGVI